MSGGKGDSRDQMKVTATVKRNDIVVEQQVQRKGQGHEEQRQKKTE